MIGLIIIGDEILSGKRQDKHLAQASALLKPRGLQVSWVRILSDEPIQLTQNLIDTFRSTDIVFCFGGIGATPDDRTRQCAAKALRLPLERHVEAVAEIEKQFGPDAYPQRIRMAEYPAGARIIPNAYNRVPGFSFNHHHFMPGFPMMAKPMMEWVLDQYYTQHASPLMVEMAIKLTQGHEGEWVEFMIKFETRFPTLRLFSLPTIDQNDQRAMELGVEGQHAEALLGYHALITEAKRREQPWEALPVR